MVQQFNWWLLQLLWAYVVKENDWKHCLPLDLLHIHSWSCFATTLYFLPWFESRIWLQCLPRPYPGQDCWAMGLCWCGIQQPESGTSHDSKTCAQKCWRPYRAFHSHCRKTGSLVGGKQGYQIHQGSYSMGSFIWEQNNGCPCQLVKVSPPETQKQAWLEPPPRSNIPFFKHLLVSNHNVDSTYPLCTRAPPEWYGFEPHAKQIINNYVFEEGQE